MALSPSLFLLSQPCLVITSDPKECTCPYSYFPSHCLATLFITLCYTPLRGPVPTPQLLLRLWTTPVASGYLPGQAGVMGGGLRLSSGPLTPVGRLGSSFSVLQCELIRHVPLPSSLGGTGEASGVMEMWGKGDL